MLLVCRPWEAVQLPVRYSPLVLLTMSAASISASIFRMPSRAVLLSPHLQWVWQQGHVSSLELLAEVQPGLICLVGGYVLQTMPLQVRHQCAACIWLHLLATQLCIQSVVLQHSTATMISMFALVHGGVLIWCNVMSDDSQTSCTYSHLAGRA